VAPAANDLQHVAQAACISKRVAASVHAIVAGTTVMLGSADPLAAISEGGAHPHEIASKGATGVLKLADGSFVRGTVKHPGSPARPFLKPTLPLWGPAYRRHAAGALRGF